MYFFKFSCKDSNSIWMDIKLCFLENINLFKLQFYSLFYNK